MSEGARKGQVITSLRAKYTILLWMITEDDKITNSKFAERAHTLCRLGRIEFLRLFGHMYEHK